MGYEDEMGEQELGLNIVSRRLTSDGQRRTVNVGRSTSDGQLQTVNFGRSSENSLAILLCDIFEMSFLTNLAFD